MSQCKLGCERVDEDGRRVVDGFKNRRICEGLFYCLKVKTRAVDAKG
jgi:hypothetical protein